MLLVFWVQTSNKAYPLSTDKNHQTTQQTDETITTQAQQSKTHLNMALHTFQKAQTYSEKRLRDSFFNQTLNITVQKPVDPIKHCIVFSYIQEKKYPISYYLVLTHFYSLFFTTRTHSSLQSCPLCPVRLFLSVEVFSPLCCHNFTPVVRTV